MRISSLMTTELAKMIKSIESKSKLHYKCALLLDTLCIPVSSSFYLWILVTAGIYWIICYEDLLNLNYKNYASLIYRIAKVFTQPILKYIFKKLLLYQYQIN